MSSDNSLYYVNWLKTMAALKCLYLKMGLEGGIYFFKNEVTGIYIKANSEVCWNVVLTLTATRNTKIFQSKYVNMLTYQNTRVIFSDNLLRISWQCELLLYNSKMHSIPFDTCFESFSYFRKQFVNSLPPYILYW